MAHIVTDRVRETTTTTGTGNITLGGAVSGFQDFDSQMANADTTVYAIAHRTAAEWEVGLGTWNTGNTLSRTTVVRSSNSNAAVNLSAGTKDIFMTFTPSVRQPGMSFTGALTPATSDLAALGSSSLMWSDIYLANGGQINWNNSATTLISLDPDQLSIAGATLSPAPGTTSYPPLFFAAATLNTTPAAGAFEMDATNFYATTDTGNRGYIPAKHFIRADSVRTYTSNTNSQTIFNSPANGRITLETGTYRFQSTLSFGNMSATSGNRSVNMLGAGTATVAAWMWSAVGLDGTSPGAAGASHNVTSTSSASIVTATTGTSLIVFLDGSFEVTGAGTMIPSTTMVTAAASTLSIGSYMEIWRIGTTSVVSVGQWD